MKKSTIAIIGTILGGAMLILLSLSLSWAITCLLVKLVAWCFGFAFTLKLATGIWVIWLVLAGLFGKKRTVKVEK